MQWSTFFELMKEINKKDCDADKIDAEAQSWVPSFTSLYQKKPTFIVLPCICSALW